MFTVMQPLLNSQQSCAESRVWDSHLVRKLAKFDITGHPKVRRYGVYLRRRDGIAAKWSSTPRRLLIDKYRFEIWNRGLSNPNSWDRDRISQAWSPIRLSIADLLNHPIGQTVFHQRINALGWSLRSEKTNQLHRLTRLTCWLHCAITLKKEHHDRQLHRVVAIPWARESVDDTVRFRCSN